MISPRLFAAVAAVLMAATSATAQPPGHETHEPTDLSYVASAVTAVRAAPDATAKIVKTAQPLDVLMVYDAVPGWVHVDLLSKDQPKATGWIKATADDVVSASWLSIRLKGMQMEKRPWPAQTKLDIMRQRARVGFSKAQVQLAIGEPLTVRTTETKAGERAVWRYAGQVITFSGDVVAEIERLSAGGGD